jgi:uncharacterized BrkB/YihY/UPF0761 family membrane protein
MAGIMLVVIILVILAIVFWLMMLVDSLTRDDNKFPNKGKNNERLIWVIVMVFLNFIGAILYYFLVRSKKK